MPTSTEARPQAQQGQGLSDNSGVWVVALACYLSTFAAINFGVWYGFGHPNETRNNPAADVEGAFANWDGEWYARIARDGYSYDPDRMSSVAFFPAFPLAGRCVAASGLDYDVSLTLVSNACFLLTLVLLQLYVRDCHPGGPPALPLYTALALTFFPPGFFFRMAYSDSLFLLLSVAVLYGLRRGWPVLAVALLVGLSTATRPVGVALALPLLASLLRRPGSARRRAAALVVAAPLCAWGLAAYMAYQYHAFGEPLAFAQTQKHWQFRPEVPRAERAWALATLEPFWTVYDEDSPAYWRRHDRQLGPPVSLQFANPAYFAATAALVGFGAWRRWLTGQEVAFAVGVLLVPYLTRSHEACMTSHARFAAVAFPAYVVVGRAVASLPPAFAVGLLAPSAVLLVVYSSLFAGWYLVL